MAPSSPAVSERMRRQRRRDTAPEFALRRALHARGHRYRVDAPLPSMPRRRADLLFPRHQVAVFVDGCFWHGCPVHATAPAANHEWWQRKLRGNRDRDRDTDKRLLDAGWAVIRVWECTPLKDGIRAVENALIQAKTQR